MENVLTVLLTNHAQLHAALPQLEEPLVFQEQEMLQMPLIQDPKLPNSAY
jgi:hypothetical protein